MRLGHGGTVDNERENHHQDRRTNRVLTDADVEMIVKKTVDQLVARSSDALIEEFDKRLGQGIRRLLWKAIGAAVLALAAYGMSSEHKWW